MITINKEIQSEILMTTMEEIVPQDSLFRKIDKYIDFTFIYDEGKNLYQRRKEHVERSFADSKQNHGYRYAMYKGVKKNQHYTWLICAAQNMKNIAIKKEKVNGKPLTNTNFIQNIIKFDRGKFSKFFLFFFVQILKDYFCFLIIFKREVFV